MDRQQEPPDINTPSAGAHYMLANGFKVFPLKYNSKEPLYAGWKESSKTNEHGTIDSLYSGENFGVHPGLTGHFVVDLDVKKDKRGLETWAALQRAHGEAPETFTVITPTGGKHLYFRGEVDNNRPIGEGVDIRSVGGYVVAPGSAINEKVYAVENIQATAVVADAPEWLVALCTNKVAAPIVERPAVSNLDAPSEVTKAVAYLKTATPAVEGQNGDDTLFRVVCHVRDFGITADRARELLLDHYNPQCVPPWSDEEIEQKVHNAYTYAQNSLGSKTEEAIVASAVADFAAAPAPPTAPPQGFAALDAKLSASRFSLAKPPARTEPVLWIGEVGVAKPGDLVVLQAKVKAGKSSAVGAMMACMMGATGRDLDFLGFRGSNPKSLPVLHIDTEQSPEDHYDLIKRTLDRAGLAEAPQWLHSYCVTDFAIDERKRALFYMAEKLFAERGGICAIFLDGVGDLCKNLNDELEANALVDKLYRVALNYRCPSICVLHENPGTEIGKTRGHFGSQLERKAASNLRLEKNGATGVIQLWGEKLRRGHIGKNDGPNFVWSKEKNMHVSCVSARQVEAVEAARAFDSDKEKCLKFLRGALPNLGDKMRASELNDRAAKLHHEFAAPGKPSRFADKLESLLAGTEPEFRVFKDGGGTSPFMVERLPLGRVVACGGLLD